MLDIRKKEDHYHHVEPWLETDWHFSFAQYRDPDNMKFGPLRVVNNDRVAGGRGWGMHSHEDMEIITWVITGEIVHEDTTGTKKRIGRNGVQKMSAGDGISHSEYNGLDNEQLHLVQIWIEPSVSGVEPNYEDYNFSEESLVGSVCPVASGRDEAPIHLEQDATIYVSHLENNELTYSTDPGRKVYLIVLGGDVSLNEHQLSEGDAVRISKEKSMKLVTESTAELLWIDLP